jgi:hypothetical protein
MVGAKINGENVGNVFLIVNTFLGAPTPRSGQTRAIF